MIGLLKWWRARRGHKRAEARALFTLAAIFATLGPQWSEILVWAVGEHWMKTPLEDWPPLISARTGLVVNYGDGLEETLRRLKNLWEERREQEDGA